MDQERTVAGEPYPFLSVLALYKLRSLPATPVSPPEKARSVALSCGLEYPYIKNIPGMNMSMPSAEMQEDDHPTDGPYGR